MRISQRGSSSLIYRGVDFGRRRLKLLAPFHVVFCENCDKNVGYFLSVALSDPSSRLSTSPPPPAIAVPLLEMGFSLRQITKALEATGQAHKSSEAKSITHRYYSGCLWCFRCSRGS